MLAKALTNDLEQAIKTYRVPVLTALALSLRNFSEDRFLASDTRTEDKLRNIRSIRKVSELERLMTRAEIGMDGSQFEDMSGGLLFLGEITDGIAVPLPSTSIVGGPTDPEEVPWTSGNAEPVDGPLEVDSNPTLLSKEAKIKRFNVRRPNEVTWRIRSPIMMANTTQVIDYLAFRCTKLQFLHSIALKWSDRRWDGRDVLINQDLYRPKGEKTDMVILAPMWMNESMDMLDPNVWGPYEGIIGQNYLDYIAHSTIEYQKDLAAFVMTMTKYLQLLRPNIVCSSVADENRIKVGRVERRLTTTFNKTLHIPFSRSYDPSKRTWRSKTYDPKTSTSVTADLFNKEDKDGNLMLTSSFEGLTLNQDGWYGTAIATQSNDIPAALPAYATKRDGTTVIGNKSMELQSGFMARRLTLPDGHFVITFWSKSTLGKARVEVIANTRLRTKKTTIDNLTSQVTDIQHFRESYETLVASVLDVPLGEWKQHFISFDLKDRYFISAENFPQHEVFFVVSNADDTAVVLIDHVEVFVSQIDHEIELVNTVENARFPNLLSPADRLISMEKLFAEDTTYQTYEKSNVATHLDGKNLLVRAKHRNSYNLHPTGSTINGWFKINSIPGVDAQLADTGAFTLFQKSGAYLPGYSCVVNSAKELVFTWSNGATNSKGFRNVCLHTSMGSEIASAVYNWGINPYARYEQSFNATSLQPREHLPNPGQILAAATGAIPAETALGDGRIVSIAVNDPYLTSGGKGTMGDPTGSGAVTAWMYMEWHARQAYAPLAGAPVICTTIAQYTAQTNLGFVFCTMPFSRELFVIPDTFGTYNPSPAAYSPHLGQGGSPLPWPVSPCAWGPNAVWPYSPLEAPTPAWVGFDWSTVGVDPLLIMVPTAMFLGGKIVFDRWLNLGISAEQTAVNLYANGLNVVTTGGGDFNTTNGEEPGGDLLIGSANAGDTKTGAPISLYSFKIFQTALIGTAMRSIFQGEGINFNEYQYLIFGQYLDLDIDKQLDFYQDELTDYGLITRWVTDPPPTGTFFGPFPDAIQKIYGKVRASKADPIAMAALLDRDFSILEDWLDEPYLEELILAQTVGLSDAIIWWDFLTDHQDAVHNYTSRNYNPLTKKYAPVTLSYKQWVLDLISQEWNSTKSITDVLPGVVLSSPVSPATVSPADAVYGDGENELFITGVKGWFGFDGLLGYRDSLEKIQREGLIFNFLQIELRFRADRAALESHLRPYAHSYDDLFLDKFEGNNLKKFR